MTKHRIANIALSVGILCTWFLVMDGDYRNEADTALQQERREWAQAVTFCHAKFGPQTQPEYDTNDRLICVGRKGQRYAKAN